MSVGLKQGDALEVLRGMESGSVQCAITSPPFWGLRDYGVEGQLGLEATPELYVAHMVEVFREVKRVLRDDGVLWLNLGDSYASSPTASVGNHVALHGGDGTQRRALGRPNKVVGDLKPKDLVGIPWMVAFALRSDGWYLRSDIIWSKPNPMPESVTDRPTKAHEYVFLLSKSAKYYYDAEAVKEPLADGTVERYAYGFNAPAKKQEIVDTGKWHTGKNGRDNLQGDMKLGSGRNRRTVWTINTSPYKGAHFATFPPKLVEPMVLAGTSEKGACSECGAPYERIVERIPATSKDCPKTQAAHEARGGTGKPVGTVGKSGSGRIEGSVTTIGWRATCNHNASVIPCTVLDPFAGSGTVGAVCVEHGRSFIGIELNPAYITLAQERIAKAQSKDPRVMRDAGESLPSIARKLKLSVPEVARMLRGATP